MKVLVTGGAGYIGSHTTLRLLQTGFEVVVLDNLCNASAESLRRVAQLSGRTPVFVEGDIRDRTLLDQLLAQHPVQAVLHFAGLKAVGQSVAHPLRYYDNNVGGTLTLCQAMAAAGVFTLVFSSSATVYGDPATVPITEDQPAGRTTNPYGRTKFMVEQLLGDLAASDQRWRVALLRYFNPVGAHESGLIGEDPHGIPNNLLPGESEAAYRAGLAGTLKELGGSTHLQIYLAEKIFQCLWWMRRYELQKQATIVNSMVDLLTTYATPKSHIHALTHNLQALLWNDPEMKQVVEAAGYTPESLSAKAMTKAREEIQKFDALIALRVKALGQLQQSYEALVNRSVMQERLKLQNELLKRDLQAIDVKAVEQVESEEGKARGQRKAKSGK